MKHIRKFSILEMMTVIIIILIFMTMLFPNFRSLRVNARTVLCQSQLRQISSLITSYAADNEGKLPNDAAGRYNGNGTPGANDIGPAAGTYAYSFYNGWNGHLLPYLNFNLATGYNRGYGLDRTFPGGKVLLIAQGDGTLATPPNPTYRGWIIMNDGVFNGGYDELKVFICPDTPIDVNVKEKFNGAQAPKMLRLTNSFSDNRHMGIPCSYLANATFFGKGISVSRTTRIDAIDSMKIGDIKNFGNKALLLEGGNVMGDTHLYQDHYYTIYENPSNPSTTLHGFDLGTNYAGNLGSSPYTKAKVQYHWLNYVHDTYTDFWISNNSTLLSLSNSTFSKYHQEMGIRFNEAYKGNAYMILSTLTSSTTLSSPSVIVSFHDPQGGSIFQKFYDNNLDILVKGNGWGTFEAFVDDPNEYHYLVGEMNVLFGDGSVRKKDGGWLSVNRVQIAAVEW